MSSTQVDPGPCLYYDECKNQAETDRNGLCEHHYRRKWKWGHPLLGTPLMFKLGEPDIDRFWRKVTKTNYCWEISSGTRNGARFWATDRTGNRRSMAARLFLWEHEVGPVPDGLLVTPTTCWNVLCVRPDHMECLTQGEGNSRRSARITHCPQGHEYTPENTMYNKDGHRSCRACQLARTHIRRSIYLEGDMDITTDAVGDLCDWICQWCFTWVDRTLPRRSTWGATQDHIVALDNGGTHTWDNVELMHFGCNVSKSTGEPRPKPSTAVA